MHDWKPSPGVRRVTTEMLGGPYRHSGAELVDARLCRNNCDSVRVAEARRIREAVFAALEATPDGLTLAQLASAASVTDSILVRHLHRYGRAILKVQRPRPDKNASVPPLYRLQTVLA